MAQDAKTEELLAAIPDLYFWLDLDGTILHFHGGTPDQKPTEDLLNKRLQDLLPPVAGRQFHEAMARTAATGVMAELEYPVTLPEGKYWYEARLRLAGSQILVAVRDITVRKRGEEERRQLDSRTLEDQKLESLDVLAGGIAHDFNNLLTIILGNAAMALAEARWGPSLRSLLEEIQTAGQRAAELTKKIAAYSGKCRLILQTINASRLVENLVPLLQTKVANNAILRFDLAPILPTFQGDPTQIRLVVLNLILNASDALGDRGGTIAVRTGAIHADSEYLRAHCPHDEMSPGDHVFLEVCDTGDGVDEATLSRIFDPCLGVSFTGRGLGLAAVRGIVRGHRGSLEVISAPGRGPTFKILFPSLGRSFPVPVPSVTYQEEAFSGTGTILIVEDEEVIRSLAMHILEAAGYHVLLAGDGAEGVSVFSQNRRRLAAVLLDLTMPEMGGEEAFLEMHRQGPEVPVILMSGYSEQDLVMCFSHSGFAGFVSKPFVAADLLAAVHRALKERDKSSIQR